MRNDPAPLLPVALALLAALTLSACTTRPDVRVVADGADYTVRQAEALARSIDASVVADALAADAPGLRREVLIGLRRDEHGKRVADFLTKEFPSETRAVPIRVEVAQVDGREAWVIVEAWGTGEGRLDKKRLWVFDAADGDVLASTTFR